MKGDPYPPLYQTGEYMISFPFNDIYELDICSIFSRSVIYFPSLLHFVILRLNSFPGVGLPYSLMVYVCGGFLGLELRTYHRCRVYAIFFKCKIDTLEGRGD